MTDRGYAIETVEMRVGSIILWYNNNHTINAADAKKGKGMKKKRKKGEGRREKGRRGTERE